MAIDSQNKRRSVQAYWLGAGPVPDGTIGDSDRAHSNGFYAGITYGTPVIVTWKPWLHKLLNLHHNIPQFQ